MDRYTAILNRAGQIQDMRLVRFYYDQQHMSIKDVVKKCPWIKEDDVYRYAGLNPRRKDRY